MLEKLQLTNFKCFRDHVVMMSNTTIMVGKNNAGKSTVIESLRILGLVTARFNSTKSYINRPGWLEDILPLRERGIKVSASAIDTDLDCVFYRYGNPPAIIEAFFSNEVCIRVYINSETELYATFSFKGDNIYSYKRIQEITVPQVKVLPQIVPLQKNELFVSKETLNQNRFSKRTSGNFRNNLFQNRNNDTFRRLESYIEKTWGTLKIQQVYLGENQSSVYLEVRDGDFVTEIYNMGHGIQMWLQTLWFIVSSPSDSIIILDEPDVYLHADLQRKLVRMIKGNYQQTIIATHSVEIISEVLPDNILIIDKYSESSHLAVSYPVLQSVITSMGSIQNISLARLLNDKRYLCMEGNDDLRILQTLYDILYPDAEEPLDHIPHTFSNGWGSWYYQRDSFKCVLSDFPDIKIYCIYDHDYHTDEEIRQRKEDAKNNGIGLHIWEQKEIENYLLSPSAIARFICSRKVELNEQQICKEIESIIIDKIEDSKEQLVDNYCDEIQNSRKKEKINASSAHKKAVKLIEEAWTSFEGKMRIAPGKSILSALSMECKTRYNTSFSALQIASCMRREEIAEEMKKVLDGIRRSGKLNS